MSAAFPDWGWAATPSAPQCSGPRTRTPDSARPTPNRLPIAENHDCVNVAAERDDPRSMLALYRRLLELRRGSLALTGGTYRTVRAGDGVLAYLREAAGERVLVALNLTAEPRTVDLAGRVRLSTWLDREGESASGRELHLRGEEGVALDLARRADRHAPL